MRPSSCQSLDTCVPPSFTRVLHPTCTALPTHGNAAILPRLATTGAKAGAYMASTTNRSTRRRVTQRSGPAVIEALTAEGVTHVFGLVGSHVLELYDALLDAPQI